MTDIDQYETYREVGTQLNSDIIDAYSDRKLIVETAEELGIEFDGLNLTYEFESQMAAHFEFALYEYRREGTTTELTSTSHDQRPGSDSSCFTTSIATVASTSSTGDIHE